MATKADLENENEALLAKIAQLEKAAGEGNGAAPLPERGPDRQPSGVVKRFKFSDAYGSTEIVGVEAGRFTDGNGVEHVQLCELPVRSIVPAVDLTIDEL